ncbi:hypothetical protein OIV83_005301 [Microbotryomycetes sp. JL201]|nr:hypothetical protein OIV83_005301 [Microbotryomycetes sp. JL201]
MRSAAVIVAVVSLALCQSAAAAPMARAALVDESMGNWKGSLDSLSFLRRLGVANATVIAEEELVSSSVYESAEQPVIYNPSVAAPVSDKLASSDSARPSSAAIHHGQATVYWQNGEQSACGTFENDHSMLVALDSRLFGDASTPSALCGKRLTITNTGKNGKRRSVKARVADVAYLESAHSLDLSVAAFESISDLESGIARISWQFDS